MDRRVALIAPLVSLLLVTGCMSKSAADTEARSMLPGMQREAELTVGRHYDVTVRLVRVQQTESESALPLPAFEADYDIIIRSREWPAFMQRAGDSVFFGPGSVPRVGGIHDWSLYRDLDEWDAARRVSLLRYIATSGNPLVTSALTMEPGDGAWWRESTPMGKRLRQIIAERGYAESAAVLLMLESGETRLLIYDDSDRVWIPAATRISESGPLVEMQ